MKLLNENDGYALDLFEPTEQDHVCDECQRECNICCALECVLSENIEAWSFVGDLVLCAECNERCE